MTTLVSFPCTSCSIDSSPTAYQNSQASSSGTPSGYKFRGFGQRGFLDAWSQRYCRSDVSSLLRSTRQGGCSGRRNARIEPDHRRGKVRVCSADNSVRPLSGVDDAGRESTYTAPALLDDSTLVTSSRTAVQESFLTTGFLEWLPKGSLLVGAPALVAGYDVEGPGSVLAALGVLATIIGIHELGHFLAARWQGIHVTKFALGFGPTLVKWESKNVEYSLRAIPLGGFVAFPDDDPESQYAPNDPNLLKNRPILDRALVISAGVLANIAFAYTVLFAQASTVGLIANRYEPGVLIPEVVSSSAAARGGLLAGDIVLAVEGKLLPADAGSVQQLVEVIKSNPQQNLVFSIQRGEQSFNVRVQPDTSSDGSGRLGVQLTPNAESLRKLGRTPFEAAALAGQEFARLAETVVDGLGQIVFNFAQTADRVSGPVAIVAVGAEVARSDSAALLQFAAVVNLNLAIVNILPLPALDGGYLFLLLIEALRGGKKLPDRLEQGIMSSGILLLLALGVVLMVRDTLNLGIFQQMMQ
eukprot:TRINITY_DN803_c0_g1_i1.p1 TRINITY_DN803_c0_g1~~TRINITY_DN803_c0_g1_i1.p1  ORF type:complete len:527 (-),score=79.47 TRINITY_DN803_c0_g1_i1:645-2225(-)